MPTKVDAQTLAASLNRLQEQPEGHTLRGSLERVVDACVQLFSVTGSGLMVADAQSVLRYAVASDGPGRELEDIQLEAGQGPCVLAFVVDELVDSYDAGTDERWPAVADRIGSLGIHGLLGVPVHLSGIPVGSLDVYQDHPYHWDESEQRALARYGEVVEVMMETAVAADRAGELAEQLNYALDYRVPIERGVGYLMARDGVDHAEAFNRLRRAARSSRRKIGEVAEQLLQTGRLPEEAT
ncbi:MAG TPA: GAF and ANTAR domain-containing protein [Jatrophihabitans sp.]|nr:GAF and ANTAR domain-containing protein [Jatrophihabitans sp.]